MGTTSGDWYSGELNAAGVPVSTMRDGTPKGYAFLNIKDNEYSVDYKVAGSPAERQVDIFHPQVVPYGQRSSAAIYANFFMGAANDLVEYSIDGGEWKKMDHVAIPDPAYTSRVNRWDVTYTLMPGRRPSNPVISSHVWAAPIPTTLDLGKHRIQVRATDMFGKTFNSESEIKVAPSVK